MKKYLLMPTLLGALCCAPSATLSAAEFYYVQPDSVKVFSRASFDAKVIATVVSGYKFSALSRQGNWVKFSYYGQDGFISSAQVANRPPLEKKALVREENPQPKLTGRVRASSERTVVAGVKGLTYEDRARVSKGERVDYDALDKVDALKVTAAELKTFRDGGKP